MKAKSILFAILFLVVVTLAAFGGTTETAAAQNQTVPPPAPILNNDFFSMRSGTTAQFGFLANDENLPEFWSIGIQPPAGLPIDHFSPGGIRVTNPAEGIYEIPYFVEWATGRMTATIHLTVLQKPVVSLPEVQMQVGDEFATCISTTDMTGQEAVTFQGTIMFPPNLTLTGVQAGDVLGQGGFGWNETQPGVIRFYGTADNLVPFNGAGSLICLQFLATEAGEGTLFLDDFMFNEWPASEFETRDGYVVVEVVQLSVFLPLVQR